MTTVNGMLLPRLDSDGKQVVYVTPSTPGWNTWITSAGDDIGPPLVRGGGDLLQLSWTSNEARGTKTAEFRFGEPVQVNDGGATFDSTQWSPDDLLEYQMVLAATATTSGGGAGNCNKVATGLGFNVIVPAAGNGAYNVNLANAIPVPSADSTGYWDSDYDTGAITPSATPGAAKFNLFDAEFKTSSARRVIFHNQRGLFELPAYGVEWVHPNWLLRCIVTKNSAGAGTISGWVRVFRRFGQV
jgi:hypothetical protein